MKERKNVSLVDILAEVKRPERTCHCGWIDAHGDTCGDICTPDNGALSIPVRSRGGRYVAYCPRHARFALGGYSSENHIWTGSIGNGRGYTFAIELETKNPTYRAFAELNYNGFFPTSDCTVDVEFKSPIYRGLNSLVKYCRSIEQLCADGDIAIDKDCGTHFHVGKYAVGGETFERDYGIYDIDRQVTSYFNSPDHYHLWASITAPLENYLADHPDQTKAVWGRRLNQSSYASRISRDEPYRHENWINLQHENTIEWRLPKFVTAAQYADCITFCRDATEIMMTEFFRYIVKYALFPDRLNACAKKCGEKILAAYLKAF